MSISHLFNVFVIASFVGWVYECTYCTVKTTRWQNRGFLFGPVCPIYGLGFLGAFLLFDAGAMRKEWTLSWPMVFVVCALGSAVLEYTTSYLLEKFFRARWWDYTHVPLNLNGRICLPATCGFGVAGVVFIEYLIPFVSRHVEALQRGLGMPLEEFFSLGFMCVLGVDLGLSISSVTSLLDTLEKAQSEFDAVMESRYEPIGKTQRSLAGKLESAGHAVAGRIETAGHTVAGKIGSVPEAMAGRVEGAAETMEVLRAHAGRLTHRQVNVLMNIEAFSSARYKGTAEKMKELLQRRLPGSGKREEKDETGESETGAALLSGTDSSDQ